MDKENSIAPDVLRGYTPLGSIRGGANPGEEEELAETFEFDPSAENDLVLGEISVASCVEKVCCTQSTCHVKQMIVDIRNRFYTQCRQCCLHDDCCECSRVIR